MALARLLSTPTEARTAAVDLVVIHTTGSGLAALAAKRAPDHMAAGYWAAAWDWYESSGAPFFGHYLVAPNGDVVQLADEGHAALHTAALSRRYERPDWAEWARPLHASRLPASELVAGWARHGRDPSVVFDWWWARWPGLDSPLDLLGGDRYVNRRSVGVDLLPAPDGTCTPERITAALELCADICARRSIDATPARVVCHEDLDPLRRGTRVNARGVIIGTGWDPGRRFPRTAFHADLTAAVGAAHQKEVPPCA